MTVSEYARRIGASAVATVAVAAVCVACSSSSSGNGQAAPDTSAPVVSATVPTVVPSVTASLPGAGASSGGQGVAGGPGSASKSAFCNDFAGAQSKLGNLSGNPGDISKVVAFFDKLAADAPSAVKADAQKFDDYLHQAEKDPSNFSQTPPGQFSKALQNLITYATTNCS